MTFRTMFAAPFALALAATPLFAQEVPPEQEQIENALVPLITFRGEEASQPSIAERMEQLGIVNFSVAVLRDGELDWARGYGDGIDSETLFQAASLSKAVGAAGIVALAMERGTSLDADISGELAGLDLSVINPEGLPITLRQLLSHTNGAGVSGFPGYAQGTDIPTTAQVIMGSGPTNTDTVVISSERAGSFNYSGGGYTIAQHWAEVVTEVPFPAVMRRYVLDPIGMERSLFGAVRQAEFPRENVALAFMGDGTPVPGGWNAYPEHAAASLWTTPSEYALFAAEIMAALGGDADAAIPAEVAREMTTIVDDGYGLGIGVGDIDGAIRLSHSGSNRGYKSNFMAYPASDDVIVVMTGAENGWSLVGDVSRTANLVYDWPSEALPIYDRLPASRSEMVAISGVYDLQGNAAIVVVIEPDVDGQIRVTTPDGSSWTMTRIGNARWIDPNDGQIVDFVLGADGTARAETRGQVLIRR